MLGYLPLALWLCTAVFGEDAGPTSGRYVAVERMDMRRVMLRVAPGEPLPPPDEDVMLDQIEHWKWRVEIAAAGAAILVTWSSCPHGLGLLPSTLELHGGGRWRMWPGTFEYSTGGLVQSKATWSAIHKSLACEGAPDLKQVGKSLVDIGSLEKCQNACIDTAGCEAIDYYSKTMWCNMYDRACTSPDKDHDGASSWKVSTKVAGYGLVDQGSYSFNDAKRHCQEYPGCRGFSFSGTWADQDRISGQPRHVYFSSSSSVHSGKGPEKWHSFMRRDSPRAHCNPEGAQFECPSNPYACLGLSIDADDSAIKQAYRSLSKKFHPDKVGKADRTPETIKQAEKAFRDISESHETLRGTQSRREADQKLQTLRRQWEEQRPQDLYIKDPHVTTLEPETYSVLLPHAEALLVHFFLPSNDECRQMKIALGRAAAEQGTGKAELPRRNIVLQSMMEPNDVFRGVMREKSVALRTDGSGVAEGDAFIALTVLSPEKVRLFLLGDEQDMTMSVEVKGDGKHIEFEGRDRVFRAHIDRIKPYTIRGTIADKSRRDHDVASFMLQRDDWQATTILTTGSRPLLYGAVNCGRFPDFCKRKGADPSVTKRFPQVRMLFPNEVRFEVYHGRSLAKDVVAFAREASRQVGAVETLNKESLLKIQAAQSSLWLLYLQLDAPGDGKASKKLDCQLCRSVLPVMRRTAPRLLAAGVRVGVVNCSAEEDVCTMLSGSGPVNLDTSQWGTLRLVQFKGPVEVPSFLRPAQSLTVWDETLLIGETGHSVLISSLEAAAAMAQLMRPLTEGQLPAVGDGGGPKKDEL